MERRPLSWPAAALVLALSLATLGDTCPARNPSPGAATSADAAAPAPDPADAAPRKAESLPAAAPGAAAETPTFEAGVRPILAERCAPCHNPGGVMYERLPFDRPEVVSAHAAGVRRRLKKEEDLKTFERWLAAADGVAGTAD